MNLSDPDMSLEDILEELGKRGQPWINKTEAGYWTACFYFPSPEGVKMEVRSSYDHPTPRSALNQLLSRLGLIKQVVDQFVKQESLQVTHISRAS